ncbi:hypothetical protein LXL04_020351 [Taraxacum kok-saghyz]
MGVREPDPKLLAIETEFMLEHAGQHRVGAGAWAKARVACERKRSGSDRKAEPGQTSSKRRRFWSFLAGPGAELDRVERALDPGRRSGRGFFSLTECCVNEWVCKTLTPVATLVQPHPTPATNTQATFVFLAQPSPNPPPCVVAASTKSIPLPFLQCQKKRKPPVLGFFSSCLWTTSREADPCPHPELRKHPPPSAATTAGSHCRGGNESIIEVCGSLWILEDCGLRHSRCGFSFLELNGKPIYAIREAIHAIKEANDASMLLGEAVHASYMPIMPDRVCGRTLNLCVRTVGPGQ